MTTIAYRQVLERERRSILTMQDGTYPLPDSVIDRMVERYAAKRETAFAKAGLGDQRRLILALGRLERRQIATFTEVLARMLNRLGRDAASAYLQTQELVVKVDPPTPGDEAIADMVSRLLNLRLWKSETWVPSYGSQVEQIALGTVEQINTTLRLGVNLPDDVMRQIISDGGTRAGLIDIENDVREAIFRALREGRELGEGADALARRIRDYVPEGRFRNAGAEYRARMIARTETKNAQNESSLQAYEQSDVVIGVRAFDNQTGYNDEDCTLRDGRVFSIADAREEQRKEHPNYTLSWAPEIDDSLAEDAA